MAKPTQADAEAAVRLLIEWAGEDPNREGLRDTPARVARSYHELFSGYAVDPRDYLKPAREAAMMICKARYLSFGCEGQAARIKPLPLEKMADRYAKGELSQVVK